MDGWVVPLRTRACALVFNKLCNAYGDCTILSEFQRDAHMCGCAQCEKEREWGRRMPDDPPLPPLPPLLRRLIGLLDVSKDQQEHQAKLVPSAPSVPPRSDTDKRAAGADAATATADAEDDMRALRQMRKRRREERAQSERQASGSGAGNEEGAPKLKVREKAVAPARTPAPTPAPTPARTPAPKKTERDLVASVSSLLGGSIPELVWDRKRSRADGMRGNHCVIPHRTREALLYSLLERRLLKMQPASPLEPEERARVIEAAMAAEKRIYDTAKSKTQYKSLAVGALRDASAAAATGVDDGAQATGSTVARTSNKAAAERVRAELMSSHAAQSKKGGAAREST